MVSIVIPAYNAAPFLRECLDSVRAQSFTDWEAVVVDDGSTDSTPGIAQAYADADSRFRLLRKPNGGLSSARNHGVAHSTGEWVTFLDSDDRLEPHALTSLMQAAPGADIVVAAPSLTPTVMDGITALSGMLYQDGIECSAWSKLYRRDTLLRIPFTEGIWYEDLDFSSRLLREVSTVRTIADHVYIYRDNPTSFLHTFSAGRLDVLHVTRTIEERESSRPDGLAAAARSRRLSANFNMLALIGLNDRHGLHADTLARCWSFIRSHRAEALRDPRVRLKNKLGALISYLGPRAFILASRLVYR